jgi:predicted ATPase
MEVGATVWTRPPSARASEAQHDGALQQVIDHALALAGSGLGVGLKVCAHHAADAGELRIAGDVARCLALAAPPGHVLILADDFVAVTGRCVDRTLSVAGPFECRLVDLAASRHVWALSPGGRSSPSPSSVDAVPNNLPVLTQSMVGAAAGVDDLADRLVPGEHVTITGGPGIGKSRLALHAAAQATVRFPGGAWIADLSRVDTVSDAAVYSAAALAVPGSAPTDDPLDYLAAIDQPTLLVLDTAEHVTSAVAHLLATLEARGSSLCVLTTSRVPIGTPSEVRVAAVPLRPDDAAALFVQRSPVAVDPDDTGVAAICEYLDGNPLAIELAAGRTALLSPAEIARRLTSHAGLLADPSRSGRHRALDATMEWSYELLDDAYRAVFRRLSVFPGGCDLDAAESVAGFAPVRGDAVLDALTRLAAHSLVVVDRGGDTTRYRLLDLARAFARDRVTDAGEDDELAHRLVAWAHDYAEPLRSAADLESERSNLVAVLSLDGRFDGGKILDIAAVVGSLFAMRGPVAEGRARIERVLEEYAEGPADAFGRAAEAAGTLAVLAGEFDDALGWYERALRAQRVAGNRRGEAVALNDLGVLALRRGDLDDALSLWEQALVIQRELGDAVNVSTTAGNLAAVAAQLGDLDRARAWAAQALPDDGAARHAIQNAGSYGVVAAFGNVAAVEADLGLVTDARASLDRALRAIRSGDDDLAYQALVVAAQVLVAERDYTRAEWITGALEGRASRHGGVAPAGLPDLSESPLGLSQRERFRTAGRLATPADALLVALRDREPTAQGNCSWIDEGLTWHLRYAEQDVHVPDAKGLRYIRHLLAAPGREVSVLDLVAAVEGGAVISSDLGPVLDARARRELQARMAALDEQVERLRSRGRNTASLEHEHDELAAFVRRATGKGGRDRAEGASAERARKAVTNRIRDAIKALARVHPELGEHLMQSVTTGMTCAYRPPQPSPVWRI